MDCQEVPTGDKKDVRRPMNAFLIFCKRHRSMVREKNPDLDNRSVTRILGDLWANLGEEQKSTYTTLAKQYKDAFMKANPDYKWHNPDKIHQPPVKMATRPTNARVIKNDVEINLDGSIVPGKLADPSKMGGLSLLLMAGQQSLPSKHDSAGKERHNSETLTSPTEENPSTSKSALLELAEMCTSELEYPEEDSTTGTSPQKNIKKQTLPSLESKLKSLKHTSTSDYKPEIIAETEPIDLSTKSPKQKNLLQDIKLEKLEQPAPILSKEIKLEKLEKQDTMPVLPAEVKPKLVELMKTKREIIPVEVKPTDHSNSSKVTKDKEDSDHNDNDIVNCGKMVVDHIIDKLFSTQKESDVPVPSNPQQTTVKTETHMDRLVTEIYKQTETKEDPTDANILKGLEQTDIKVKQEMPTEKDPEIHAPMEDIVDGEGYEGGGIKRHLQDFEDQDNDDMVPVRKSRRRNRGQRYQELINEGIIQPSKERLAARKAAKTSPDEEVEEYEEYPVMEEVMERKPYRKRGISECEEGDDLKKYKTGDFDLEAHIADLPACSLEQLSKGKKTIPRVRHLSDSSAKKPPVGLKEEGTSCLPPHVRLKSTDQSLENIVGSRRRKIRKHSITHLIPAKSVGNIPIPVKLGGSQILIPESQVVKGDNVEVKGDNVEVKGDKDEVKDHLAPNPSNSQSKPNNSSTSSLVQKETKADENKLQDVNSTNTDSDSSDSQGRDNPFESSSGTDEKDSSGKDGPEIKQSTINVALEHCETESKNDKLCQNVQNSQEKSSEPCDMPCDNSLEELTPSGNVSFSANHCDSLISNNQDNNLGNIDKSPDIADKGLDEPKVDEKDNVQSEPKETPKLNMDSNKTISDLSGKPTLVEAEVKAVVKEVNPKICDQESESAVSLKGQQGQDSSVNMTSASALRMDILAAEMEDSSPSPSMHCQGSPSFTVVHS